MKNKKIICIVFILLCVTCPISCAHSGRTDGNGGHNSSSGYHYHHGYPAHQHTNGICPYDYEDTTTINPSNNKKYTKNNSISNTTNTNTISSSNSSNKNAKNLFEIIIDNIWLILTILFFAIPIFISFLDLIKDCIESFIKNSKKSEVQTSSSTSTKERTITSSVSSNSNTIPKSNNYICPRCGGRLRIRNGRYGNFIGCSNYPRCTYTRKIKK